MTMYAVFDTGGKQHRVSAGDLIDVEKIDVPVGETIEFGDVLLLTTDDGNTEIGSPYLADVKVVGEVVDQIKDKKIIVFKSKRRKGYKRKLGHRQKYTRLRIENIVSGSPVSAESEE